MLNAVRLLPHIPHYLGVEAREGLEVLCRYLEKHAAKMDYPNGDAGQRLCHRSQTLRHTHGHRVIPHAATIPSYTPVH